MYKGVQFKHPERTTFLIGTVVMIKELIQIIDTYLRSHSRQARGGQIN